MKKVFLQKLKKLQIWLGRLVKVIHNARCTKSCKNHAYCVRKEKKTMALDRNNLVQLMKTVAKADPSTPVSYSFNGESFSYDALNETLRQELQEYAGTYSFIVKK